MGASGPRVFKGIGTVGGGLFLLALVPFAWSLTDPLFGPVLLFTIAGGLLLACTRVVLRRRRSSLSIRSHGPETGGQPLSGPDHGGAIRPE
jgi:hypothetical protein